jgi:septum formation protein
VNPFLPEAVQRRLVLASASPRRRELLERLGFEAPFKVSDFVESNLAEDPIEAAKANALGKARDVAKRHSGKLVLGADTVVILDGRILGKPVDAVDAARMLTALSGREHDVVTALALVGDGEITEHSCTRVQFRDLSSAEIEAYVASGEPMDKAGAYGIQGLASQFVTRIEGCYFNVMGLPLELLTRMLSQIEE